MDGWANRFPSEGTLLICMQFILVKYFNVIVIIFFVFRYSIIKLTVKINCFITGAKQSEKLKLSLAEVK